MYVYLQLHQQPRTCLTCCTGPLPATRMIIFTYSTVDALTSGCVAALGTSTGKDARPLTGRRPGESTTRA